MGEVEETEAGEEESGVVFVVEIRPIGPAVGGDGVALGLTLSTVVGISR